MNSEDKDEMIKIMSRLLITLCDLEDERTKELFDVQAGPERVKALDWLIRESIDFPPPQRHLDVMLGHISLQLVWEKNRRKSA